MKAFAVTVVLAGLLSPAFAAGGVNYRVPGLSGGYVSNENFNGKIVIIDVWATWCGPCQMVIPHLVELHREYEDKGVVVVGINANNPGEQEKAKVEKFVDRFGITYPIGMMTGDAYVEFSRVMGVDPSVGMTIPSTIIVDRRGRIIKKYPGYFRGQEKEIRAIISRLLLREGSGSEPQEGER